VFPKPLERSRVSSWVSCICWSFWQLQSQPHWPRWWHSVGGRHCPKCRPLLRPMWRCDPSSTAAASNHRAACRHHEPAHVVPSCWERPRESSSARWRHWCSCGAVFCWRYACKRTRAYPMCRRLRRNDKHEIHKGCTCHKGRLVFTNPRWHPPGSHLL